MPTFNPQDESFRYHDGHYNLRMFATLDLARDVDRLEDAGLPFERATLLALAARAYVTGHADAEHVPA